MNDKYAEIKLELELTKKELLSRLLNSTKYETSSEFYFDKDNEQDKKEKLIINHIKEDLRDVEDALKKMEYGIYGICEETGETIPLEKLKILPTARTIYEFSFTDLYLKNVIPFPKGPLALIGQK